MARPRGRGKKIDTLRWTSSQMNFNALSAGSAALNFLSAATIASTLMRSRGQLIAYTDSTVAPPSEVLVSVGLIVVPEGQSTTVIWDPFNDDNAPWWMYAQFVIGYEEHVVDVVDNPTLSGYRETIDVKGMRRLRPDEEVQCVVTNTTIAGAQSINLSLTLRTLIGQ